LHLGRAVRHKFPSSRTGTVVSVRDAFYNVCDRLCASWNRHRSHSQLPVRRSTHPTRTLDLVKREMEVYSLGCPGVAFSLDTTKSEASRQSQISTKILVIPVVRDSVIRLNETHCLTDEQQARYFPSTVRSGIGRGSGRCFVRLPTHSTAGSG